MNYFAVSGLLNFIVSFVLGLLVFLKNPRREVNRIYLFYCLAIAYWSLGYWRWLVSDEKAVALFWTKFLTAGSVFIPITYLHFILVFLSLQSDNSKKRILHAGYAISLIFFALSPTSLFVRDVHTKMSLQFWPVPGPLYPVFLLMFFCLVGYAVHLLFTEMRRTSGYRQNQIKYVFIGSIIGFGGGSTNFPLWYDVPLYPYGNFAVLIFFVTFTYAIARYRLMDINLAVKKTAAYSLAAGLLTGLFVALVLTITNLFSTFANVSSFKISIFAALLIAMLFNPLRHRIQSLIDKIFYKKTFDYYATVRLVSSNLATMFDQDSIFKFIGDTLYDLMGLKSIHLLMAASGGYETVYYSDKKHKHRRSGDKNAGNGERLCLNKRSGIAGFYLRSEDIIVRDELSGMGIEADTEAENIIKDFEPFHGEVAVPVFVDRKLMLLIILGGKVSGDMFGKEDVDLLQTISNQTAGSLKNARLYQEKINSERLASIGMMSATFAHEIRNPLTSLKTFAQLMPEKYNDPEFRETFSRIVVGEIEKIDGLIGDLLDFSARKKPTRMNNYDLTELIDTIIEDIKGKFEFEKKNIVIKKNYNGSVINMSGDTGKLKQAFGNIILNGCQAMHGEGILRVDIKAKGKYTDVEIRDTGEGIQPEDLPKIFDPFVTTKEMGVGLGLAISKRVIENHNGKIHVVSQPAKGTTFIISLPAQIE